MAYIPVLQRLESAARQCCVDLYKQDSRALTRFTWRSCPDGYPGIVPNKKYFREVLLPSDVCDIAEWCEAHHIQCFICKAGVQPAVKFSFFKD